MWNVAVVDGRVVAVEVGDPVAVGGDHHGLVLAEFDGVAGVLDERGDVGADEHLAVADADHQRRGAARGDDGAGIVGVGEHQGEVALQAAQHGQHRAGEVARGRRRGGTAWATRCTATSVSVSLANSTPAASSSCAQRREVLDDAVVDDGDLAGGVAVRVRVAVGRAAVGGPAGVAQAGGAGQRRRRRSRRARSPGWPAGRRADGPSSSPSPSTRATPAES